MDNEKGGQLDQKSRRKFVHNASKWINERFCQKNRPCLDQIISGTKCDRDKLIFLQEIY